MKKLTIFFLSICILITSLVTIPANAKEKVYTYNKNTRTLTINIQEEMKYDYINAPWIPDCPY